MVQQVVGMLLPRLTFPQMIFWQWLNQSHNACFNYANRNATKVLTRKRKTCHVVFKIDLQIVYLCEI